MKKKYVYYVYKSINSVYVYLDVIKSDVLIPDIENYILCHFGCGDYIVETCTMTVDTITVFDYSEKISI